MTELYHMVAALECCADVDSGCSECYYWNKKSPDDERYASCIRLMMKDLVEYFRMQKCREAERGEQPDVCEVAPEAPQLMTRDQILSRAKECVCGEREQDYGTPENSFQRIANLWTAYKGTEFSPADAAVMLGLLKIARIAGNPKHMDNWVDLAGYAACGGEVVAVGG